MKLILGIILSGLIACAPKMVLECPVEGEAKVFPEKTFDLQIKFCEKNIFLHKLDMPIEVKIKNNFVEFLEKKGLIYDTSNPNYVIKAYIYTFNIFSEPPSHLKKIDKIIKFFADLNLMKIVLLCIFPGVEITLMFFYISQITHYNFKGILNCKVIILREENSVALNKNYNIYVHKKEVLKKGKRLDFAFQLLCETLQKFFSNFEKDLKNVLSN